MIIVSIAMSLLDSSFILVWYFHVLFNYLFLLSFNSSRSLCPLWFHETFFFTINFELFFEYLIWDSNLVHSHGNPLLLNYHFWRLYAVLVILNFCIGSCTLRVRSLYDFSFFSSYSFSWSIFIFKWDYAVNLKCHSS